MGAFDGPDKIHQRPLAQGVLHHVRTRTDPIGAIRLAHVGWQFRSVNHTAPCHHARVTRRVLTEQGRSDHGVNAIGANHRIGLPDTAIGQAQFHTIAVRLQALQFGVEHQRVGLQGPHGIDQYLVQIGPVHGEVGVAIHLPRDRAQIKQGPGLPRVPQTNPLAQGLAGHLLQSGLQSQAVQNADRIGPELNPRANFTQGRRLLQHGDAKTFLQQGQGRAQPTQSGTNDADVHGSMRGL